MSDMISMRIRSYMNSNGKSSASQTLDGITLNPIKSWTEYHRVKKWYHIRGKNANHQAKAWKNHIIWEDECL